MVEPDIKYYFIGIGGIGMSGLAGYLKRRGCQVAGYDLTPSSITSNLSQQGVEITFSSEISGIPGRFRGSDVTVVYTPAIPNNHHQLVYFNRMGNRVIKRAALLGELSQMMPMIAVAGTHGKTTTASIITHLLVQSKIKFTAFVGGIMSQYQSNYVFTGDDLVVVEADEFDRSFLHLFPTIGCVTSVDADHLDIYQSTEALKDSFVQFTNQIKKQCVIAYGIDIEGITYGLDERADYYPKDYQQIDTGYQLSICTPTKVYHQIEFHQIGRHNLANLVCAVAALDQLNFPMERIIDSIGSFQGIERRMQVQLIGRRVVVDDYAHHPSEIAAVLQTVEEFYPTKKSCVIFQPHLYSRTRDFVDEFARVLSRFSQVVLLDIYPARELPIKGISSHLLLGKIVNPRKSLVRKKQLLGVIQSSDAEVVLFLGAGDIGIEAQRVSKELKELS